MYEEAKKAIAESSPESSVYIGCDSVRYKKNGKWRARYSTVIVLHKDSKHGCQLFYDTVSMDDYGNMKQRLLNEVSYAIAAASEILEVIGDRHLEIHLDLNTDPKHKSNIAVKEAAGYVMGMGIEHKLKPDAWAATHAADHCARGLLN